MGQGVFQHGERLEAMARIERLRLGLGIDDETDAADLFSRSAGKVQRKTK